MSSKKVTLVLTPAQARMVNAALALLEADDTDDLDDYSPAVMERTRTVVWAALTKAGVPT